MVRKLKHHEQKLLKKVDFLEWKHENNVREIGVMRRYHIQSREDYEKYNKLIGGIRKLANSIAQLDVKDPHRDKATESLLEKCYALGLIPTKKGLAQLQNLAVSALCRRRLPIVMVRLKMAETVREAVTFVEQGHVRVGPETITDPAFMVTRSMEDFMTWVDTSKIRRKVLDYNNKLDDYDLL